MNDPNHPILKRHLPDQGPPYSLPYYTPTVNQYGNAYISISLSPQDLLNALNSITEEEKRSIILDSLDMLMETTLEPIAQKALALLEFKSTGQDSWYVENILDQVNRIKNEIRVNDTDDDVEQQYEVDLLISEIKDRVKLLSRYRDSSKILAQLKSEVDNDLS